MEPSRLSKDKKNGTANPVIEIPAPTKERKQSKLSFRERRLIKNLQDPNCKSLSEAMRASGYAESTIRDHPGRIVGNSRVKEAITEIMDRQGITDDRLVEVLGQGLGATKVISAMVIKGDPSSIADEKDGMKEADSMTKDFIEVDDYMARHKYLETGLKLRGHLQSKVDVNVAVETYEQKRKRLGLDDMSPEEAYEKFKKEQQAEREAQWAQEDSGREA